MGFLDVRTVMLSHIITDAACTAVLVTLWVQNRKRFAGISLWVLDFACQTAAVVVIVLRGSIPDWVSLGFSGTLVVTGAFLGYAGLVRFMGWRGRQVHNVVLLAVFVTLHLYLAFVHPNLAAREVVLSLGLLAMCFQCVWLALRRVDHALRGTVLWVGVVFAVFCLVSVVRIFVLFARPPGTNDFFRSGSYDTLLLMVYQILLILLTFALALMVNQRLLREIRIQEEKFSKAFRSSPYGITLTRLSDGLMVDVNDGFVNITGYSLAEAIGKSTVDLRLWANEADRSSVVSELSKANRVVGRELQFRRKSGELLTGLFSAEIISIGDRPWVLSSINDITERKRAEEALRRHTERLRNLHRIDQAVLAAAETPEAIAQAALQHLCRLLGCQRASVGIFDPEGKRARVFAAEARGETIVRTGEEIAEEVYGDIQILRRGDLQIVEDVSRIPSPSAVVQTHHDEGMRSFINAPLVCERGLLGALNVGWRDPRAISPEEAEIASEVAGEIAIAIEQSRLLHETRRFAVELEGRVAERTAELEAANKELEAFAYSVSHDLRSPLRAINGYTRILLEDFEPHLDAEGKRVCAVITESARDMGTLIDDLLAFSRIGRTVMQPSPVDMTALARSIFFELTSHESRERIDLIVGPLPRALGDPSLLRQVWTNLLSNAVKFSSRRERAVVEVSSGTSEGEVVYSVRDNGAGFDMQYVNKLFGVFQRLHSTKEFEGMGVGLAIVQRIIHRHGGRVWAEGDEGKGATFHFTMGKRE